MEPTSSIGGHVDDGFQPVDNAMVYAYNASNHTAVAAVDQTDDTGQYRLFGLDPGTDYHIFAELEGTAVLFDPDENIPGSRTGPTTRPGTGRRTT